MDAVEVGEHDVSVEGALRRRVGPTRRHCWRWLLSLAGVMALGVLLLFLGAVLLAAIFT